MPGVTYCQRRCHLVEGYDIRKCVPFFGEYGYSKCTVCKCHYYKVDYARCKCCNHKLKTKSRHRKNHVVFKPVMREEVRRYYEGERILESVNLLYPKVVVMK